MKELPESIGNLKSLEKLDATRSGIRILPPCINGLVKLEFLSCSGCGDLTLPPLTGLPSRERLLLQDCGLPEISVSLGSLKSLLELYLDGNNLKKLPVTIKQLSKLTRLECIPELPSTLWHLSVQNCTCLETILSFTEVKMDEFHALDARNCINLDKTLGRKIMDDMLLRIERISPWLRYFKHDDEEMGTCGLEIAVCLAGDEVPGRMKHKNENGSTIFISMEPIPVDTMVIVYSAVVTSTNNEARTATESAESGHSIHRHYGIETCIKCQSCFVTESGCSFNQCRALDIFWDSHSKPNALSFENNWVGAYTLHYRDKHRFTEASFRLFAENGNFRVKKCGVHLLYSFDDIEFPPLHVPSFG